jgi:endo-1,4-beta-mannosidase
MLQAYGNDQVMSGFLILCFELRIFLLGMMRQVILAFVDNWQQTGGVDEYVKWTGDPTKTHKDFYTDPVIMGWCVALWLHASIFLTYSSSV